MGDGLDGAESLEPGHGLLDLGIVGDTERLGGRLSLEARVSKAMSAYAQAEALWNWRSRSADYAAMGGLRLRW